MEYKELKPAVNHQYWPLFEEYLEYLEEQLVTRLVNCNDPTESDLIRGKIQQIRQLLALKDNVLLS